MKKNRVDLPAAFRRMRRIGPTACRPSCRCVCLDAERATPQTGITRRSEYRVSFRRTFRTPNRSLLRHATRLSYIDLPVEATVGFRLSPTSRFDLHAGPYLSRLLRAKVPRTAPYTIRNWDTGICIGFDFIVGHFVIGPEVQYGLLRVTSSGNEHNIGYSFTVGYRF